MQISSLYLVSLLIALSVSMILSADKVLSDEKSLLTVATVCMNAAEDKDANIQTFFSYMEEAAAGGAHLIVFPEIALQQNPGWGTSAYKPNQEELDYVRNTAEEIPGDSTQRILEKAKELNIYVVFGMTEVSPDDDSLYNSSVFLGPDGIIGKYRKINLWDASLGGNEHLSWSRGKETGVFDSPIGKVGLVICADMFRNLGPVLAKEGAELLVTASAWPANAGESYEQSTKRNASQAQLWHIVSNQIGAVGQATDYGHSRVIDPNGNIIADTGQKEGMIIVETGLLIDMPAIDIPFIDDAKDTVEPSHSVNPSHSTSTTWGRIKKSD